VLKPNPKLTIASPDNSRLLTPGLKVPCWIVTQAELEEQLWLLCSISLRSEMDYIRQPFSVDNPKTTFI